MPSIIDSDDERSSSSKTKPKLFSRERDLHSIFGGGKVADIVLWRNKHISAGVLAATTAIWFLFEVIEYHFLTLVCHLTITTMLAIFIWCNAANLLGKPPPKIPEIILSESQFKGLALAFHSKLSAFSSILYNIASGEDLKIFLLAVAFLWILSVVGSYCSSISLLYTVVLCIQTIPVLYERHEDEVHDVARRARRNFMSLYRKIDSEFLGKIPRATTKQKKAK